MGQRCRGWMDGCSDAYLASPADFFAGVDDISKEREPGIEIIERTVNQSKKVSDRCSIEVLYRVLYFTFPTALRNLRPSFFFFTDLGDLRSFSRAHRGQNFAFVSKWPTQNGLESGFKVSSIHFSLRSANRPCMEPRGGGGTPIIFSWGCAAGTLRTLANTRPC